MSNLLGSDPQSWSVTEVSSWIASLVNSEKIAEQFLDNDVDGSILLHNVDDVVLKTELEIKSFGKRCKILNAIESLKNGRTNTLGEDTKINHSTQQSSFNSPSSILSHSPSQPSNLFTTQTIHAENPGLGTYFEENDEIQRLDIFDNLMDSKKASLEDAFTKPLKHLKRSNVVKALHNTPPSDQSPPTLTSANSPSFNSLDVEEGCDSSLPRESPKIRSLSDISTNSPNVTEIPETTVAVGQLSLESETTNEDDELPMEISHKLGDPSISGQLSKPTKSKVKRTSIVSNTKSQSPRLPLHPLKEEHLFFTPLQLRRAGDATFLSIEDTETEVEFVYKRKKGSRKFLGEASIAQRRLKRLLREMTLFDNDEITTAYQLSKSPQVPVRLFRIDAQGVNTRLAYMDDLIRSGEDVMSKFKAVASVPMTEVSNETNNGVHNMSEEEDVLPLYGDSDWEDYEFDSELERELRKENRSKKLVMIESPIQDTPTIHGNPSIIPNLSKESIEQAIQKYISQRVAQWEKNKLPEFELQKINTYQKEKRTLPIKEVALRSLKERLEKQIFEIANGRMYSEEDVLKCCEHSEELGFTLDSMSVLEWKIALLKGPEPIVEDLPTVMLNSSESTEVNGLPNDGVLLESEPEVVSNQVDEQGSGKKKESQGKSGNGSISTSTPPPRNKPGNSSISTGTPPPRRHINEKSSIERVAPANSVTTPVNRHALPSQSESQGALTIDNVIEERSSMKAKLPLAAKSSMSNKMGVPAFLFNRNNLHNRETNLEKLRVNSQIVDISIISSSEDEEVPESAVSRLSSIDSLPNDNSNRLETYDNPDDIPPGYVYMSRHQEKKSDPIVLSSSSDGSEDESESSDMRKRKPDLSNAQSSNHRGRFFSNSKRHRAELKNSNLGRKNIRKIHAESDQVLKIRQETQRKAREVEDRIRMNQRRYEGTSSIKDSIKLLINPGHDKSQSDIFILPELAKYLKPHQIEGVRFMWKNIVMFNGQGCVLSHAMGLGKTFQVITFLFTLMRENRLGNSTIPSKLKPSRILILCPPTLIENWHNEFYKWIPREHLRVIGWVYKLGNACKRIDEKIDFLQKWYRFGGILLMGYQAFRDLVSNQGRVVQTFEQSEEIKKILLEAPSIVIADEGHIIKNPTTKISLYIKQLQTKSRICLTGYPLQNNLEEYWCMVDFVYPMFLGSLPDFRNAYINPINNGLYPDSTPGDRKLSSTKLYVLSGIISEIVLRKDTSVLHRDLPEKVEYIIACKMTDLQYQLYTGFLRSQMNDAKTYTNENIIAKGHVLLQICNHPCVFKTAVVSNAEGERNKSGVSAFETKPKHAEVEEITIIDLENERPEELPEVQQEMKKIEPTGYGWTNELFEKVEDPSDIVHCHKMKMLLDILVACKNIKEKVLVFSRSIPTLDYMEHVLKRYKYQHFKYLRLDGETPIQNRQDMIDRFNQETDFDVFLISSGAGSLGVNLVSASRVVIYDVGWNPSFDEQAIARAYRYGQTRKVYVYRLQTYSTFEDKLFKNNVHKVGLFVRVVDKKNPGKLFTKDQMKRYLDFPEHRPVSKLSTVQYDDSVISDMVDANKNAIIEITLHSTLLNEVEGDLTAEDKCQAQSLLEHERRIRNPIGGGVSGNGSGSGSGSSSGVATTSQPILPLDNSLPLTNEPLTNPENGKSIPESMMPVSLNPT